VTEVPGRALDLAWAPGAAPSPRLSRVPRVDERGPYEEVGATPDTTFRDTGLGSSVTYFYVVVGLDEVGNEGRLLNERDSAGRLHRRNRCCTIPVSAPVPTLEDRTLVSGLGAGAPVRLRGGLFRRSARAPRTKTATARSRLRSAALADGPLPLRRLRVHPLRLRPGVLGADVPIQGDPLQRRWRRAVD
jgi:hypothetical protein